MLRVLPLYSFGFVLSAAQVIFGWSLLSRTPNEAPVPTSSEQKGYTYHNVIETIAVANTFACATWIFLLFLFYRAREHTLPASAGWHASATIYLAVARSILVAFNCVIVLLSPHTPTFAALATSCGAVGFRSHACAPLGVLLFLPIAEVVTLACASATIRRRAFLRYGSARVQLIPPLPPPPPPPPAPRFVAAWTLGDIAELDTPLVSATAAVPLVAPVGGASFGRRA
ncbi:hypothetical protein C8R46DRAFT_1234690 [Mycena filopes]|nr:hypothetical protein C8R46DRAFT_1234690 [Mycena filopes]